MKIFCFRFDRSHCLLNEGNSVILTKPNVLRGRDSFYIIQLLILLCFMLHMEIESINHLEDLFHSSHLFFQIFNVCALGVTSLCLN